MMLRTLHREARRLVTTELMAGSLERWPERAWAPLSQDADRPLPLDPMDRILDDVMSETERFDTAIDRRTAPALHQALPLTRREASDPGVFRYLTVVHRPDFVRHRWEHRSPSAMRSRFWSMGTRHDSNAMARLWWIAELTRDGADYTLTDRVLGRPTLAAQLFARELGWYRPAVAACVDVLEHAPRVVVARTLSALAKRSSTIVLESRSRRDLGSIVRKLQAAHAR